MNLIQQTIRKRRSIRWIWEHYQNNRAMSLALFLLITVTFLHTLLFYGFEHAKNSKLTLFDSFWVTCTTFTTVGYGDISAATVGGRWTTIVLGYAVGLSLFAWVGSEVVSRLLERILNRRRGMVKKMRMSQHFLIVNFPGEEKVRLLIEHLRASEDTALTPIVVVTDAIDALPFQFSQVRFIRGSVTNPETFKRANVSKATHAIVLAMDHEDPNSDAITAAAVSIIESINSDVITVAECVFEEHRSLFRHVQCDRIVLSGDMLIRLLVQETQDIGAAQAISRLLDHEGNELYSVKVGKAGMGRSFREVLMAFVQSDECILPIGYTREQELFLNPSRTDILKEDDMLVFLKESRPSWNEIPLQLLEAASS